ncbi:hypothetical protein IGI04_006998, partial [Brassica rapa subsp. trilocularis]
MGYMWQQHKRVIGLELGGLQLGGVISPSIGNLSFLISLDLSNNSFGGTIPQEVGKLFRLEYLYMSSNVLRRGMPTSLSNCSRLLDLHLYTNPLGGGVPSELGALDNIGRLSQMTGLILTANNFSGSIPATLANISTLQELRMEFNSLTGSIPPSFGKQQNMQTLALHANYFGSYSDGDLRFFNALSNGTHLLSLSNLTELSPGENHISGSVPRDIGNLIHLQTLQLYGNLLSGPIPTSVGKRSGLGSHSSKSVECDYTSGDHANSSPCSPRYIIEIPDIRGLVGLKRVDLSNNISGSIPGYFSSFPLLEYLNQSNNNFEGRVPTKAKFQNSSLVSVSGNNNLCGGIKDLKLKPCFEIAPPMDTECPFLLKKVVIGTDNPTPSALETFHGKISYREIRTATDDFSLSNLIGSGSFGTVFKALLPTMDKVVAVKVLNMERRGTKKRIQSSHLRLVRVLITKETNSELSSTSSCPTEAWCLTLILEVGLRCCEGSPTNSLAMSQADKELISVRE